MSAAITAAVGGAVIGGIMSQNAADTQASATQAASQGQQQIQQQQLAMAQAQWQRYTDTYTPLENEYVNEARDTGSIANQNKAAAQAAATNSAAYATARERLNKNPGISPNDQAYLQEANKINLADAAGSATAQNSARDKVIDRGTARMTDALSLGKGLPAQAGSTLGAASSTGAGVMNANINAANQQYRTDSQAASGIGQTIGGLFQSKTFQNWLNSGSGNNPAATTPITSGSIPATENNAMLAENPFAAANL